MASLFQLSADQTNNLVACIGECVKERTLILVRGIPGLGKSTLGRVLCQRFGGIQIENDMQFMISGEYMFDPVKLEDAHMATQLEVRNMLAENAPCVVVSNTFTRGWEMAPYRQLASKFNYRLVIVDLLLCVRQNAQIQNAYFNTTQFLEFLGTANVHTVPADKIRSMYDRYELSDDVITVHDHAEQEESADSLVDFGESESSSSGVITLKHPRCEYRVLDTGYYLALDLVVSEDINTPHSSIYQRCIGASQHVLRVFGANSGCRMLRKLTVRNAKSHGTAYAMQQQEALTGQACTNPHAHARNAAKLAAGWTRFHVTLLSPTEYTALKKSDSLAQFLMFLEEIDFAPLMQATSITDEKTMVGIEATAPSVEGITSTSDTSSNRGAANESTAMTTTCDSDNSSNSGAAEPSRPVVALGMQRGTIAESGAPFHVDALGEAAGLSKSAYTTSVYLLFDPTLPTLQALTALRGTFGLGFASVSSIHGNSASGEEESGVSSAEAKDRREAWQPHITLAFTHNDVRVDPTDPETCDKQLGVQRFRELAASLQLSDTEETALALAVVSDAAAVTDLEPDCPVSSLAMLLLYSEVQASFRMDHFGFTVIDVKVRRGPMGDDATYRAHPFLQAYLPRGVVYLQRQQPGARRVIYRGLFSLRKFYGKEGVEDDGIGIGASQMNFKLKKVLETTETILVMEKVNGRAASSRFFTYEGVLYVLVGTKLSHVVCRVDQEGERLVMPQPQEAQLQQEEQAGNGVECGDGEEEEEGPDSRQSPATTPTANDATAAGAVATAATSGPQSTDLIQSNVTALRSNLRWDRLDAFVAWLGGRTFNGEVLDPREMHLVVIDKHEWMSLCVTQFIVAGSKYSSIQPAGRASGSTAGGGGEEGSVEGQTQQSALQDMFRLAEFTHCVPAYESHSTSAAVAAAAAATVDANANASLAAPATSAVVAANVKQALLNQITQRVVHARNSEGKVLYFLDPEGRVLELLKFKTWWYIWRRSCRELVSSLFSRFYSASATATANAPVAFGRSNKRAMEQDAAEAERIAGQIANFSKIREQMLRAKPESQANPKFQEKLSSITGQLQQLRVQEERRLQQQQGVEVTDYDVTAIADELCLRVQRKWTTKFSFFQAELGDATTYTSTVERVMGIAQQFVRWCQARFAVEKNDFHRQFREVYPVVWDRFLQECNLSDVF